MSLVELSLHKTSKTSIGSESCRLVSDVGNFLNQARKEMMNHNASVKYRPLTNMVLSTRNRAIEVQQQIDKEWVRKRHSLRFLSTWGRMLKNAFKNHDLGSR